MAQKITDQFYRVSPIETLTFRITGPDDPHVFLDNLTLSVQQGVSFDITPVMLSGQGAVHFLNIILMFPGGLGNYQIDVAGAQGNFDQFTVDGPNQGDFTKVQVMIQVGGV